MTSKDIEMIPLHEIRVMNPRSRNRITWLLMVTSIRSVGLKRPILVFRRPEPDSDGYLYELVCGQGRLEAFRELKEESIPAFISDASQTERYLMSLVENIARRAPSNASLYYEVKNLCERGYDASTIAAKLGLNKTYAFGVVHLLKHGHAKLIKDVESGKLPMSVAIEISNGDDDAIQKALSDGYASGEFRGKKLTAIRRLIEQRSVVELDKVPNSSKKKLSGPALMLLYKERIEEQKRLVSRANQTKERLLLVASAMRQLVADEDFITVLHAENLLDMPDMLKSRM